MKFNSLCNLALVSSTFLSVAAGASGWTNLKNNNPSFFNVDWHKTNYSADFGTLPLNGSVANQNIPWSDSYWPKDRGAMAYPWHKYSTIDLDINISPDQAQSLFFNYHLPSAAEVAAMSQADLADLSPTVKYDIFRGDFNYKFTKKVLGKGWHPFSKIKNSKDRAYWEGYCNAWSAVSLHYAEPKAVIKNVIVNGTQVLLPFGSADVKALLVADYADNLKNNPGEGNLCKQKLVFPAVKIVNGKEAWGEYPITDGLLEADYPAYLQKFQTDAARIGYTPKPNEPDPTDPHFVDKLMKAKDLPECSDTNAGVFHIVLANQLGNMHEGFVIDKTRDVEIWNQPVFRFKSTVVGQVPVSSSAAPGTLSEVQVKTTIYYADDTDYGWAFWNPTLTNLFTLDQSFLDEYNTYQNMLVKNGEQDSVLPYPANIIDSSNYIYNLELNNVNGTGSIIGGEWVTYDRPDIMWLPHHFGFTGIYDKVNALYVPNPVPTDAVVNF